MNVSSLEFNFANLSCYIVTMHYQTFTWYLISQKQLIREIGEVNPMRNLRLLSILAGPLFLILILGATSLVCCQGISAGIALTGIV